MLQEERVTRALGALTERQRDVMLLTCWEGFSYAETAEILGLSPGTVGAHRDKALKNLRRILEGEDAGLIAAPATRGSGIMTSEYEHVTAELAWLKRRGRRRAAAASAAHSDLPKLGDARARQAV
ncbi:MAG: sigma-70 family RNA polymerase sigma factor [Bryobacterales bacterium]